MLVFLISLLTASAHNCPKSGSLIHATCQLTAEVSNADCSTVATEIIASVHGENGWVDPHNGGTYTLDSGDAASSTLEIHRSTGGGKYTDKMRLDLSSDGSGACKISACSASQVFSVYDYSTNYCNLHDLWCGSQDGCPVVKADLSYSESRGLCLFHDKSKCVVKKQGLGRIQSHAGDHEV